MDNWEGWKYLAELSTRGVKSIYGLPRKRDSKIGIGTTHTWRKNTEYDKKKTLKSKKKNKQTKKSKQNKNTLFSKKKNNNDKRKKNSINTLQTRSTSTLHWACPIPGQV